MSGTSRLLDARVEGKDHVDKLLSAVEKVLYFMDNVPTDEQLDITLPGECFTGRDAVTHSRNVANDVKSERGVYPFDALLAERRAILAGERAALEAAVKKDAAWWREVGRG